MEVPWYCRGCREENWIDLDRLTEWPLDRLMSAMGFICSNCGMREAISYTTPSMRESERKLLTCQPTHKKHSYYFAKVLRKQTGVNRRGEAYGESKHPHMVIT